MALSGVATAAALGLLGLSAGAAAAPTTPGSASLALASSAQTSAGVPRVLPAASTTLTEHVTDELGILDASKAQQAVETMSSKYGVGLWVLTVSDSSQKASAIAAQAFKDTKLGRDDMLLVINIPSDGSASKSYKLQAHDNSSKFSESDYKRIDSAIKKQLRAGNYDDAVAAIPDNMSGSSGSGSSGDSGSSALPLLLGGGAVAAGGAAAWTVYKRRKNKENDDMLFGKRRNQSGAPGNQPAGPAAMTVEQLRTQAGSALVQADDTVRAAAEELSYAQAQFGLSATDAFTAALDSARKHLSRCFELRKILDDDIPETEPQQRQMYTEILQHCSEAVGEIRAQEEAFNKRRGIEANLPTSIAETAQRADETEQAIVMAETILVTLSAAYPASSLTSVAQAPEQARRLLAAGRTALDQARASVEASQEATAVEQVRIAQGSIAQAGQLAAQVTGARERLQSAAKDLEAAIASISSDLVDAKRLEGAVPAATLAPLVADAEAAVAEGRQASGANPSGDPLAALDHLARAEAAIDAGAHIINDVSGGLADPAMHDLIARTGVVYVCQHWRGDPETMDRLTDYPGPKGQIHYAGEDRPWFYCDTIEVLNTLLLPEQIRKVNAVYVQDMGRADWDNPKGAWIDARTALYVQGSKRKGSMGATLRTASTIQRSPGPIFSSAGTVTPITSTSA